MCDSFGDTGQTITVGKKKCILTFVPTLLGKTFG